MNAITEVREQAIRSCLQAGFSLKQIATVLQGELHSHTCTSCDYVMPCIEQPCAIAIFWICDGCEVDEEFHAAGCVCLDCSTGDFDSDDLRVGEPSRA